jgi:predicted nucleotidyltransferase
MMTQLEPPLNQHIAASPTQIAEFCQRWHITEFALFGSVLRDDFRPDSDIDVLVTFAPDPGWNLFD